MTGSSDFRISLEIESAHGLSSITGSFPSAVRAFFFWTVDTSPAGNSPSPFPSVIWESVWRMPWTLRAVTRDEKLSTGRKPSLSPGIRLSRNVVRIL